MGGRAAGGRAVGVRPRVGGSCRRDRSAGVVPSTRMSKHGELVSDFFRDLAISIEVMLLEVF